jgi:hypothetical protein
MSRQAFDHFAIQSLAKGKQQAPQDVPGAAVQQLWDTYVQCDFATRDATLWLGDAAGPSAGAGLRCAPSSAALSKALSSTAPVDVHAPEGGSLPQLSSGMPPLNSPLYAEARERATADVQQRETEEKAAAAAAQAHKDAESAMIAKTSAAAAAAAVAATSAVASNAQSQAEQSQAAAAEALRLLGTDAVTGLRHRGLQPLVFPSRPDAVALYGLASNGTLALQGNVPLADARSLGLQTLQHVQAQAQAAQVQHAPNASYSSAAHSQQHSMYGGPSGPNGGMMHQGQ